MSSFFTFEPAEDDLYKSLRDGLTFSENEKIIESMFSKDDKGNIERMWSLYEPYADRDFLQEVLDIHHQHQGASYNEAGSPVSTDIFLNSDYDGISAILFSNVDALNYPNYPGNDFVLIHNPVAKNPLPIGFIKLGREYWVENSTLKHSRWINH